MYTMLLQLCGILNICQTLVLSSVGSILSWVLVLRQRMPIYSDPTLNRETFSISSGKIWQQLSTWGIPISPLFSPRAGPWAALNRRNDPHSKFRTRGAGGAGRNYLRGHVSYDKGLQRKYQMSGIWNGIKKWIILISFFFSFLDSYISGTSYIWHYPCNPLS